MKRVVMSPEVRAEYRERVRLIRLRLWGRVDRDEYFCPKDFHHYSGVDVCVSLCRKRRCYVFQKLSREHGA